MTKVYIETSALGFYYDDKFPTVRDGIRHVFSRIEKGELEGFTSTTTIDEVGRARPELAARLMGVLRDHHLKVVPVTAEMVALAAAYLEAGIIPSNEADDATHAAVAVLERADLIVSYNLSSWTPADVRT